MVCRMGYAAVHIFIGILLSVIYRRTLFGRIYRPAFPEGAEETGAYPDLLTKYLFCLGDLHKSPKTIIAQPF